MIQNPETRPCSGVCVSIAAIAVIVTLALPAIASDRYSPFDSKSTSPERSPVVNGEFVHNIGNLHMNITNWGFVGSLPNSNLPMRDAPSAQYPAGSGVEYLYAAGIWVGAVNNGIPSVSTGYPETEFRPEMGPRGTIYRSFEGDLRGSRYPSFADDDNDGSIDEDFLNGLDDDRDGLIDEDFAAIGNQMFSCEYTDDKPVIRLIWPEHEPMRIRIRQESYQWGEDVFNDFVGMRYTVTNIGFSYLTDIYIGIYADLDAGPRERGTYYMDDLVGLWEGPRCAPKGDMEYPVDLKIAYVYDADGDNGATPGYFGVLLLGHTTSIQGGFAPAYPSKNLTSFHTFRGLQPFVNGGEPTNDFERYQTLSEYTRDSDTSAPGDYRILLSTGPFYYLTYNMSVTVDIAYVAGNDLDDMLDNAAAAQIIYKGCWFDLDGNPESGVLGRESPLIGPLEDHDPDPCDGIEEKLDIIKFDTCWTNIDCWQELIDFNNRDCYRPLYANFDYYRTGIDGKEYQLHWITDSAPPPPNIRVLPGDHNVTVFWDNLSEVTPDIMTLENDFEGYQIWRADDWHRPLGTSEENGPSHDLWSLLENRDLVNGVMPDRDFQSPVGSGGWSYSPLKHIPGLEDYIRSFELNLIAAPMDKIPCPPGLTEDECDTLDAIARFNLGREGGKQYYRFIDYSARNGMPYFYSVIAYDHKLRDGVPIDQGKYNSPASNFKFVTPLSSAQNSDEFDGKEIYAVPNPVTSTSMAPWKLGPVNDDASGLKVEIRNLPRCLSTIRIFTLSGDLVITFEHDGSSGNGTLAWNLVSRNGQDITSGVYIFAVAPEGKDFPGTIGKFVVIR